MIEVVYKVEIHFEEEKAYEVTKQLIEWMPQTSWGFHVYQADMLSNPYVVCFCKNISQAREFDEILRNKINEYGGTIISDDDEEDD